MSLRSLNSILITHAFLLKYCFCPDLSWGHLPTMSLLLLFYLFIFIFNFIFIVDIITDVPISTLLCPSFPPPFAPIVLKTYVFYTAWPHTQAHSNKHRFIPRLEKIADFVSHMGKWHVSLQYGTFLSYYQGHF